MTPGFNLPAEYITHGFVTVKPLSDSSPFHWKIIATKISYRAVAKMIDGNSEHLGKDDVQIIGGFSRLK